MDKLKLRLYPDPVLRTECTEVPPHEIIQRLPETLEQMKELMLEYRGAGLAAPQVGLTERFFVMQSYSGIITLVNPVIIEKKGKSKESEGCLSVPDVYGKVERAAHVRVKYLNEQSSECTYEVDGRDAHVLQHEIDHLDGILFIKYLSSAKRVSIGKILKRLEAFSAS